MPLYLMACSSTKEVTPKNSHKVSLSQDAIVSSASGANKKVLKGESLNITEPTMIESEGHVGVLVLPSSPASDYELKLKPISEWGGATYQEQLGNSLSILIAEINDVQLEIGKSDYSSALIKIEELKKKYPFVGYLNILESSCYLAKGDRSKAESLLKLGMSQISEQPNSDELKRYINNIEGEKK